MKYLHISIVILNYNTNKDLQICTELLSKQVGIKFSIILVDNASQSNCLESIKHWLMIWRPNAICGDRDFINEWVANNSEIAYKSGQVFLIENNENKGYSAGNNVGIRLAEKLGSDAVLIVNPDMRIDNTNYLATLTQELFSNPNYYIAASRIVGLNGEDQNPLRELFFWEELLWPMNYLKKLLSKRSKNSLVIPYKTQKSFPVQKVSGCCVMIRMSFLRTINFMDENVFLYCEEPILSTQVRQAGGNIIFVPNISAIHAHINTEKGNAGKRMHQFIKSRKYYLKNYSNYSVLHICLLYLSYTILMLFSEIRKMINK